MSDNPHGASPAFQKRKRRSPSPRAGSVDGDSPNAEQSFGCPYYIHDPSRHNECKMQQVLKGTDYVEQHLKRHHQQPIHCPCCGETFEQRSTRDDHMKERSCEPRKFTHEGMTQYQVEALKHIPRKTTQSERWRIIWDILFPGEPRPDSLYVDDPIERIATSYAKRLSQRPRDSITTTAPKDQREHEVIKDDAVPEGDLCPEALTPNKPSIVNPTFSQLSEDPSGRQRPHQYATGQESGFTTPSHPEPTFIDSFQFATQTLGDQQGHSPPADLESWLTPGESCEESFYTEYTSLVTPEPSLVTPEPSTYAEFRLDTTPYPLDPSSENAYPPDHGFQSPDVLECINDPTFGFTKYDDVTQSLEVSGSAVELDEDSGIDKPPAPHFLNTESEVHAAGPSEQGGRSFRDSRFASHGRRDKTREEEAEGIASIYSMELISPESKGRYITAISNRLAEDIRKLARNTTVSDGSGELLLEWMRTFALKVQGESSTMAKREASVFIWKYSRYVAAP